LTKLGRRQELFFEERLSDKFSTKEGDVKREDLFDKLELKDDGVSGEGLAGERVESFIGLDHFQRLAVESRSRIVLVKAGPGTGKTMTLTHRIAYLIENRGVEPERILALTFTNQAALEMKERLKGLVKDKAERIQISTVHSFCMKMLRDILGSERALRIIDVETGGYLLKEILAEADDVKLNQALSLIRRAKMFLVKPEDVAGRGDFPGWFYEAYFRYQSLLDAEGLLDFDDLIFKMVELL